MRHPSVLLLLLLPLLPRLRGRQLLLSRPCSLLGGAKMPGWLCSSAVLWQVFSLAVRLPLLPHLPSWLC